jgi:hypothetical protein
MFGVVERAFTQAGVGPVVRLNFGGAVAGPQGAGTMACNCGVEGALGLSAGLLSGGWGNAKRELRGHQARAVLGGSQDALCLEGLLGNLYAGKFDVQARHLWVADTAFELLQPEVVLVGNDRCWEGQAFVQLARQRGIPSVCVQDGVAGNVPFWWWLTADRLAATSQHLVQMLVRHGVPPERCRVTGQPRYDGVARFGPEDQRAARVALGLDPSKFSVLFAVQGTHPPDYVRTIVSALLGVPGIHVMLRPHPSDRRGLYERVIREQQSERVTLHRAGDSLTLVRACDALVTQQSTVVLEAALLEKPVIVADLGGGGHLWGAPFGATGIAISVGGLEELTREVQRLATALQSMTRRASRPRQETLETLLGPVDGHAGDRVAALVAETLETARGAVAPAGARQPAVFGARANISLGLARQI